MNLARKALLYGGLGAMLLGFVLSALDLLLLVTVPVIFPALLFLAGLALALGARRQR